MIYIDAEQLQDGLYNIKDGKIYKYKAKGGTVRTYELRNIIRCGECKYCVNGQCWKSDGLDKLDGNVADDDFCSRGEREGE